MSFLPPRETRRVTVPALEEILYQEFPILDHGFIRVLDYMGDDFAIVQAARVSYGKGTKKVHEDKALIDYLMRHHHTTPFEACEIKFHVKLPIFVARQWVRHRTASISEISGRYSVLEEHFYLPDPQNLRAQSRLNRQGGDSTVKNTPLVSQLLEEGTTSLYSKYQTLLGLQSDDDKHKLARELARIILPTNLYTQWYWKIDLHNLFHFLELRTAQNAQFEIRVYAQKILDIVKLWVPIAYEAFLKYRLQGVRLSQNAIEVIKKYLEGQSLSQETSGLGRREWQDLKTLFNLKDKSRE